MRRGPKSFGNFGDAIARGMFARSPANNHFHVEEETRFRHVRPEAAATWKRGHWGVRIESGYFCDNDKYGGYMESDSDAGSKAEREILTRSRVYEPLSIAVLRGLSTAKFITSRATVRHLRKMFA